MSLKESGEMYLETIFVLSQKNKDVRSLDVAEYMGFSKPSVSRGVNNLKKEGYITVNEFGHLCLTQLGQDAAQAIYKRHNVLKEMLINLGVDEDIASRDACKMEHVISKETFDAIERHINKYGK